MLARLKADIQRCVDCDLVYSPDADAKRQLIGTIAVFTQCLCTVVIIFVCHFVTQLQSCSVM